MGRIPEAVNDRTSRSLLIRPYGVLHPKLRIRGVLYQTDGSSPRDSNIIVGDQIQGTWSAGKIQQIVTHTLDGNDIKNTTTTFLVVRAFKPLTADDLLYDGFRQYPYAGGRLFYAEMQERLDIATPDDVLCHFALTHRQVEGITQDCIHVLPLDREVS